MTDWKRRCESLQQELSQLVHAVSHDLRAPLRAADGFSRVLLARNAANLDAEAQDYLQRIRAATAQMGSHIEALVRLARITTAEVRPQQIDLGAVARGIVDELQAASPQRLVEVRIAEGLEVEGDLPLVKMLLECLLGNAWKFTRQRATAEIELGRKQEGGETVYSVRDNGAGFDMSYARHLFEPFSRLHSGDEFEGVGIGLALARRIVHRHGGRIEGTAVVEEGATFSFTMGELS